jgi:adenylylsulfate kinase-like enzyme
VKHPFPSCGIVSQFKNKRLTIYVEPGQRSKPTVKKVLIPGAGGTTVAGKLRKELPESAWQITIIDNDEMHHLL